MSWKHHPRFYDSGWENRASESWHEQSEQPSDSVYIKGSCRNNGREGAQGGIGVWWRPGYEGNISGKPSGRQTNQRASLEAAIKGIEQAKAQNTDRLTVYTDNHLIIKGMNEWISTWKENGWKTSKNKNVVNKDLFDRLDKMTKGMKIDWEYSGSKAEGNIEAQRLAREATRK